MNCPPASTSLNRASSSGISGAYCALTSISGICTAPHSSRHQIRREQKNACNDGVFDVSQVVMRMGVRGAERPTGGAEAEAEDGDPEQREHEEAAERDAHDPGRD